MAHRDNLTITSNENILVITNSCDQLIININSFLICTLAGVHFSVNGAQNKMGSIHLEIVSNAYTLVTLNNNKKFIFKINYLFLDRDPNQTEALLQPHQIRSFGVVVDDCASYHLGPSLKAGGQCMVYILMAGSVI